jgi:hypothetical protein
MNWEKNQPNRESRNAGNPTGETGFKKLTEFQNRILLILSKKHRPWGYFGVPTLALPRNVAFSSTTNRGASMSPCNVQPA